MDNSPIVSGIECDLAVANINDDCPPVIKEFFLTLSINIEKN